MAVKATTGPGWLRGGNGRGAQVVIRCVDTLMGMQRLRPAWIVAFCATVLLVSAWLPWLSSSAGRANAIGGKVGSITVPPHGFGVGQSMVLLSSCLFVAAAMAARRLSARIASTAALAISVLSMVLETWYYRLYVHGSVTAGYGFYVGISVTGLAVVLSVLAMVVAWSEGR
ncbi:hypothetical protein ABIA30_003252 [Mycobacterium sp. MAA66]|uniref:hypothetical protein n=1 Tax=Mycobacterium sp. MAA66 TaxID=3156297 RepID=UPI003519061A